MAATVSPSTLHPDTRLTAALFSTRGVRLLPAGVMLSGSVHAALVSSGQREWYVAADMAELAERCGLAAAAPPALGQTARIDTLSIGGLLALPQGQQVQQHHVDAFALGTFQPQGDWCTAEQHARRAADSELSCRLALALLPEVGARAWGSPEHGDTLDIARELRTDWPSAAELADLRATRIAEIRTMLGKLVAGVPLMMDSSDGPMALVDGLIELCGEHPFRFAELALGTPRSGDYLPEHLWTTSAIAVGMAERAKWPRAWCRQAGLAGLLADAGMTVVPAQLRFAPNPLTDQELVTIQAHVAHSVLLLAGVIAPHEAVLLAVAQHHEREDGSGYPGAMMARRIHPLAKLLAVADSYAAATSPRPYRSREKPALPYEVMQRLIALTSEGRFERKSLRPLVDLFGLFPVGSTVSLSDGGLAIVVGADPIQVDRPLVRRIDGRTGEFIGGTIVLANLDAADLFVLEAVPPLTGRYEGRKVA